MIGRWVTRRRSFARRPSPKATAFVMSSAGSSAALFGDRRAVLIIDLGGSRAEDRAPQPLGEAEFTESPFAALLRYLRPYHSPPETSVFYLGGAGGALQAVAHATPARFTSILILLPGADDSAPATTLAAQLQGIFPSVVNERYRALRPSIILVTRERRDNLAGRSTGVETELLLVPGQEAAVAQRISDLFVSGVSLPGAATRAHVRVLEETRPCRSALADPPWLVDLVGHTYTDLPADARLPEISGPALERLRAYIDEWDFYAPSLSPAELVHVVLLIFDRFALPDALEVPMEIFGDFVLAVAQNYHQNPYHNFQHAVDVLQCCYYVLSSSMMMRRMLRPLDVMALFVAALSHDVGHTSFNNPFLVEHESLLAWLYNDRAVLENLHSSTLFALLRHPRYNFASQWSKGQWRDFRSLVIATILGTDMSQHFEYIRQFQGIDGAFSRALRSLNQGGGEAQHLPLPDRKLLAIAIIKFADICNVIRPFASARRWGFHLVCEFFHQGDWERILGYPSTPMTTRSLPDLAKGQQYFLNNVAGPLYRCMAESFSELHFAEDSLRANLEAWRAWRPEHDPELSAFAELYPPEREERHHSH